MTTSERRKGRGKREKSASVLKEQEGRKKRKAHWNITHPIEEVEKVAASRPVLPKKTGCEGKTGRFSKGKKKLGMAASQSHPFSCGNSRLRGKKGRRRLRFSEAARSPTLARDENAETREGRKALRTWGPGEEGTREECGRKKAP